jgi:transmembrane sensor
MASDMFNDATLAKYLSGESSPEEQLDIRRWLDSDPANERELSRIRDAWQLAAARSAPAFDIEGMRRGIAVKTGDVTRKTGLIKSPTFKSGPSNWRILMMPAAAALAAAAAFFFVSAKSRPSVTPPEWREVATTQGQRADVYLSDGTHVLLAPESHLRFTSPLSDTARDVMLEGHALFEVKHDSLHPFSVRTAGGVIADIGTRFDVRQYAGDSLLRVVVAEGRVAMSGVRRGKPVELSARDFGTLGPSGQVDVRRGVDVAREMGWSSGRLTFEAVPLRDAIRELRRYYAMDFVLADSAAGARRLTASFSDESASEIPGVIALSLDLKIRVRGKTVIFFLREPQR